MTDHLELLRKHHGSPAFADLMEETSARRFNAEFWSIWQEAVDPGGDARQIVDVGTGPGLLLKELAQRYPQADIVGMDVLDYMTDRAKRNTADFANVKIVTQDLHAPFDLPSNTIDVVVCSMVLHELQEPLTLCQEIVRVLRPGGRVLIQDWVRAPLSTYLENQGAFLDQLPEDSRNRQDLFIHFMEHNRYTVADLQWLLSEVGLQPLFAEAYRAQHWRAVFRKLAP